MVNSFQPLRNQIVPNADQPGMLDQLCVNSALFIALPEALCTLINQRIRNESAYLVFKAMKQVLKPKLGEIFPCTHPLHPHVG